MDDPLSSSRYCIEHANRRIEELQREIVAFVRSDPYARVIEPNADGTKDLHKVKLTKPLPAPLPGIAKDAVLNLRDALDHAGYAVAIAAKTSGKKAHFPFGKDATEVQSRITGSAKHIPKEVFDVMASFEPHERGKGLLWVVNELANTNKHEVVVPIAIATGNMHLAFGVISGDAQWPPQWDTTKNEMILLAVPRGKAVHYELDIQVGVVLRKVQRVSRVPAAGALDAMRAEVESVVMAIEAEARRIGLFK